MKEFQESEALQALREKYRALYKDNYKNKKYHWYRNCVTCECITEEELFICYKIECQNMTDKKILHLIRHDLQQWYPISQKEKKQFESLYE